MRTGETGQMPTDADPQALLGRLRDTLGAAFGSDLVAQFLYVLVRMHRPDMVVELGRGLGLSALHLAVAAAENGTGRVITVDDEDSLRARFDVPAIGQALAERQLVAAATASGRDMVDQLAAALGVTDRLIQVQAKLDLAGPQLVGELPLAGASIDLLFSDFHHAPEAIVRILAWALPRMSPCASIIIDSASTWWPSWLLLERLVGMLSAGQVPEMLADADPRIRHMAGRRRFTLVPLTMPGRDSQNGPAWLRIEPLDLVPWPNTVMRSPNGDILGW
jgi:predicted O-methyltransferase YrrM